MDIEKKIREIRQLCFDCGLESKKQQHGAADGKMDRARRLEKEIIEYVEKLERKQYENAEPLLEIEQDLTKYLLEKREEGKVVFWLLDELMETTVENLCKQPVDGILWDLNRDEVTCVTFAHDDPTWVNDFATAQVIRYLHGEVERLRKFGEDVAISRDSYEEFYAECGRMLGYGEIWEDYNPSVALDEIILSRLRGSLK